MEIKIEPQPNEERLNQLGVSKWAIWKKEASTFPCLDKWEIKSDVKKRYGIVNC